MAAGFVAGFLVGLLLLAAAEAAALLWVVRRLRRRHEAPPPDAAEELPGERPFPYEKKVRIRAFLTRAFPVLSYAVALALSIGRACAATAPELGADAGARDYAVLC
jgi:hypothetical protein